MNMKKMKESTALLRPMSMIALCATLVVLAAGCGEYDPKQNTPTSGRLIVFVDEAYAPLVRALADTFLTRTNASIEVRAVNPRQALQEMIDSYLADTLRSDTATSVVAIIGRRLLPDEQKVIVGGGLEPKEYIIGYDGLAVAVPVGSPLQETTVERLTAALRSPAPTLASLDTTAPAEPLRLVLPDQNSSSLLVLRSTLLGDSSVTAQTKYVSTVDSALAAVAAGEGVTLIGWYAAHRDSARVRTLRLGSVDSTGAPRSPVRVHPASLVMGSYPLKQPIVGYTFSSVNSLAIGFLASVARGGPAQRFIVDQGLQGENIRMRLVTSEAEEE